MENFPLYVVSIFSAADGKPAISTQVNIPAVACVCVQHLPQKIPVFPLRNILKKCGFLLVASRSIGDAPIRRLADHINALAGKEIGAVLDLADGILYGTLITKGSAGQIKA